MSPSPSPTLLNDPVTMRGLLKRFTEAEEQKPGANMAARADTRPCHCDSAAAFAEIRAQLSRMEKRMESLAATDDERKSRPEMLGKTTETNFKIQFPSNPVAISGTEQAIAFARKIKLSGEIVSEPDAGRRQQADRWWAERTRTADQALPQERYQVLAASMSDGVRLARSALEDLRKGNGRSDVARKTAETLARCAVDSGYDENWALLIGFLDQLLELKK